MVTEAAAQSDRSGPRWASSLGVVAVVLGVLLAALQGNEWMKWTVLPTAMPAGHEMPVADCPADDVAERSTEAECQFPGEQLWRIMASAPSWFPPARQFSAMLGVAAALASILAGGALVNRNPAAPGAALAAFAALIVVDTLQLVAVIGAGPGIRQLYLADTLTWFLVHLMLVAAVLARPRARVWAAAHAPA